MLDKTDKAILRILEGDARTSFNVLSDKINLSKTPSWNRVQSLERDKVITGYRAVLSPEKLGLNLQAYVQARVAPEKQSLFEEAVNRHGSILQCHATTGEADYILHVLVPDVAALDKLLRIQIAKMPGVKGIFTVVCLREIKTAGLVSDCL